MIKAIWIAAAAACSQPTPKQDIDPGEDQAVKARDARVGTRAASATLELVDGERVPLDDLLGHKPVYLKFWATWCEPCREQMPHLENVHRTLSDRIAVFAVNLGVNDS